MSLPEGWEVSRVPPEQIDLVWSQVAPHIERGLRHGAGDSTSLREIYADILTGNQALWVVHKADDVIAAIVLSVVEHPLKRVVFVTVIAGRDFSVWAPHVNDLIRDYRDLVGADAVEAMVRKGLTRWLPELGWKRKAILMELRDG